MGSLAKSAGLGSLIGQSRAEVINLYKQANLAAICVTQEVLNSIANDIAKGLLERYKYNGAGLKILILMNLPKCAEFVRQKISTEMMSLTGDHILTKKILDDIEFIPTVIDRIVTNIPQQKVFAQLEKQLIAKYNHPQVKEIMSSSEKLLQIVREQKLQFNLFNAEKNFSMYLPDCFPEAVLFPTIKITEDLDQIEAIKNKYINGPHAILAWMGAIMGCATIAEAIKKPEIYSYIKDLLEQEIGPILKAEYPNISTSEFDNLEQLFFKRCASSNTDPVVRVGRDPLRKLASGGRIRGTLELAQKHQLHVSTPRLEQGIAAGIKYAIEAIDPTNPSCQKIQEIYYANNHSYAAVLCYSGPSPVGHYKGFDPKQDKKLINNILEHLSATSLVTKANTHKISKVVTTKPFIPQANPYHFWVRPKQDNSINLKQSERPKGLNANIF